MDKFILRAQNRAVLPDGAVLHASAVGEMNFSLLFLAPSGGGKSTIRTILTRSMFAGIGDDSVVVAKGTDSIIRSLPCGSMKQGTGVENIGGAPLKAVFFLEKGAPGMLIQVSPEYAFYRITVNNPVMAWSELHSNEQKQAMRFLEKLTKDFPFYILRYHLDETPEKLLEWTLEQNN